MLEAMGRESPDGYTVRYPPVLGWVTATLSTTAMACSAGTPPWPATGSDSVAPLAEGPAVKRVSRMRDGTTGV